MMTHDELVERAVRWLKKPASKWFGTKQWSRTGCGVVVPELVTYSGEIPDAIGWVASGYSYAIECKTSLADFNRDREKPRHRTGSPHAGAECFYMCERGVIAPERIPDGWGLLYVHGRSVSIEIAPKGNAKRDVRGEMGMMYSLLRRVELHGHLRACLSPKWGGFLPAAAGPQAAPAQTTAGHWCTFPEAPCNHASHQVGGAPA